MQSFSRYGVRHLKDVEEAGDFDDFGELMNFGEGFLEVAFLDFVGDDDEFDEAVLNADLDDGF